jgi:hypothetical protein
MLRPLAHQQCMLQKAWKHNNRSQLGPTSWYRLQLLFWKALCQGFTKSYSGPSLNRLWPKELNEYFDNYLILDYLGPVLESKWLVMQTIGYHLRLSQTRCYNFALLYIIFSSFPTLLHNSLDPRTWVNTMTHFPITLSFDIFTLTQISIHRYDSCSTWLISLLYKPVVINCISLARTWFDLPG